MGGAKRVDVSPLEIRFAKGKSLEVARHLAIAFRTDQQTSRLLVDLFEVQRESSGECF